MERVVAMTDSPNASTIKRFYDINDGRITGDLAALFTDDVQLYTPHLGIAHGLEGMAAGHLGRAMIKHMSHHVDEFKFVEQKDLVIVEGTTQGETLSGRTWDGRKTIAGHFCAVFEFRDGKISRMHVYFDPDFEREHASPAVGHNWQPPRLEER